MTDVTIEVDEVAGPKPPVKPENATVNLQAQRDTYNALVAKGLPVPPDLQPGTGLSNGPTPTPAKPRPDKNQRKARKIQQGKSWKKSSRERKRQRHG